MTLRSYFRSFFTREYWEAAWGLLIDMAYARRTLSEQFWERAEREADDKRAGKVE